MDSLWLAKAFYFCFYAAGASLIPFLSIYYQSLGFSGKQIGLLAAISPFVMLVSTPIWGGIADARQQHKVMLVSAIAGGLLSVVVLSQVGTFPCLVIVVTCYAFFASPIIPLIDNTVMSMLGERRELYGQQRLWGAIGWGISGSIVGVLADRIGLSVPFYGYWVMMFLGLWVALKLPVKSAQRPHSAWQGLLTLLRNQDWVIFLIAIFISGTGLSIITNFLFLYLGDLGINRAMMGLALTIATISEIPVLFLAGSFIRRWGAKNVLYLSLVAAIIRSLGYALFPTPWVALSLQLLHGLTFSSMWAAGVSYASQKAPPGMGATAQSIFFSVVFGFSSITGALLGGYLFEQVGGIEMFRWSGIVLLITTLFFLIMNFIKKVSSLEPLT
jgi:PPP family 3-phenylpropionic acid transporter